MAKDGHEQSIGNKEQESSKKGHMKAISGKVEVHQLTLNHLGLNVARDEGVHSDLELAQLLGEGGREA